MPLLFWRDERFSSLDVKKSRRRQLRRKHRFGHAVVVLVGLTTARTFATIFYVSPTGSDNNNGTSPATPWGSVDKVDSTNFQPGDQILFQYGSNWNASLNATSSGTTAAPIVYGAYGKSSLGNPTFYGSDTIGASAFTQVTGTTYQATSVTPVNWVYLNHAFTDEAADDLFQAGSSNYSSPSTQLSYVESTPNSFYYNAGNGQLFLNAGSTLTGKNIGLGVRQDAIYNNFQSNLIFRNLNTAETAADAAGYGLRIQGGSNVQVMNSTVALAGKHNVGLIDTTGATVSNVIANGSAPGQGFGGASGFVSYNDAENGATSFNGTSVYNNDTYVNPNGAYQGFISHGNPGGISSIALNNLTSLTNTGTSIVIYSSQPSETVSINGGTVDGNIELDTNNSVINGITIQGIYGRITLGGNNTVVQNTVLNITQPQFYAGDSGAILDSGTNNTARFNVINEVFDGPAVGSTSATSNTSSYGNVVVDSLHPSETMGFGEVSFTNGQFASNYNLYTQGVNFLSGPGFTYNTLAQWQAMGYDVSSLVANILFNNSSAGDFSLQSNSPGLGLVPGNLAATNPLADSMLGGKYSNGNYNAGLNPYVSGITSSITSQVVLNNGQMSVISPAGNTLSIKLGGSLFVLGGSSLDLAGNINNAGIFAANGPLIQTGNFNNSGSVIISGTQTWSPGSVFTNTGGTANFNTDAGGMIAPVGYLLVNISGGAISFGSSQHLAALNIMPGGTAQLASQNGATPLMIVTPALTVAGGTLDLTGNDLIVQSGSVSAITALVAQAYNGGQWNGFGITSTLAAANTSHLTAIGVILNSNNATSALYGYNGNSAAALGLFDGATPNSTDVLVKYTYYGDNNLDGKVDGSDYSLLDNGYANHLTGWYNGDYNYDGVVNGSDYTLIDNAYNEQGPSLAASISNPTAVVTTQIGTVSSTVPEPTAIGLLSLAAASLGRRKRARGAMPG